MQDIIKREVAIIEEIENQVIDKNMSALGNIVIEVYKKIDQPMKYKYLKNHIENLYVQYSTVKCSGPDLEKATTKAKLYGNLLEHIERLDQ